MTEEQAWFPEDAVIEIEKIDSSNAQNIHLEVTNFNTSGGERETDTIQTFHGGQITQKKPQSDVEVELEVVITDGTFEEAFMGASSTSDYVKTITLGDQDKYRVLLLFTTDATVTTARGAVAAGSEAIRYGWAEAYAVTWEKESAADGYWKGTLTFKLSPKDADADPNQKAWHVTTDSSGGLGACTAYTDSSKWDS